MSVNASELRQSRQLVTYSNAPVKLLQNRQNSISVITRIIWSQSPYLYAICNP
jgi:hypothetical protein